MNQEQKKLNNYNIEDNNKTINNQDINFDKKLLMAFIGNNYQIIIQQKFSVPALLLSWIYTLYRKVYILTIIGMIAIIILGFLPSIVYSIIVFVFVVVLGINFNKWYISYAKKQVSKIKMNNNNASESELINICKKKGGTSFGLAILIYAIFVIVSGFLNPNVSKLYNSNEVLENYKDTLHVNEIQKTYNSCDNLSYYEKIICMKKNINNGFNYTKEDLINFGFKEIEIDDIDLNTELSLKTELSSLRKFDITNNVLLVFAAGGSISIKLVGNEISITYYNDANEIIENKKINNIKSMHYYKISGLSSMHYVYLISNDNDILELKLQIDGNYSSAIEKDFEKLDLSYKYDEFYYLYQYSTTSGVVGLNIGKDENGVLRFISNEKEYKENIYKVVNDKVFIMKNRDIYIEDQIQSFKLKLEYNDCILDNKINYILSSENFLYDSNMNLKYDKKVIHIFNNDSAVITIFEDGKNFLEETIEIK